MGVNCRGLPCTLNILLPSLIKAKAPSGGSARLSPASPGFLSPHLLCQGHRGGQSRWMLSPRVMMGEGWRGGAGQYDARHQVPALTSGLAQPGSRLGADWPRRSKSRSWAAPDCTWEQVGSCRKEPGWRADALQQPTMPVSSPCWFPRPLLELIAFRHWVFVPDAPFFQLQSPRLTLASSTCLAKALCCCGYCGLSGSSHTWWSCRSILTLFSSRSLLCGCVRVCTHFGVVTASFVELYLWVFFVDWAEGLCSRVGSILSLAGSVQCLWPRTSFYLTCLSSYKLVRRKTSAIEIYW